MTRTRRRWITRFTSALILLVGAGLPLMAPTTAEAARACQNPFSVNNDFDGKVNNSHSGVGGVSAVIFVRNGQICTNVGTGVPHFWSGWSMVTENLNLVSNGGYAQSGFDYTYSQGLSGPRNFAQSTLCSPGCTPDSNFTTQYVTPGSAYHYYTQTVWPGVWDMYVGSTSLLISSFNSSQWTGPFGLEYYAEVSDLADDVPGVATAHMGETSLQYKVGTGWQNLNFGLTSVNDNGFRWTQSSSVSTCLNGLPCFDIWTANP